MMKLKYINHASASGSWDLFKSLIRAPNLNNGQDIPGQLKSANLSKGQNLAS